MLGATFYHNTIRKYVTVFGSYFEDIFVVRLDDEGKKASTIPVPIKYATKANYIKMLQRNQKDTKVAIQLPSLSFSLIDVTYDDSRRVSQLAQNTAVLQGSKNSLKTQFHPMPYAFRFQVSIWAKSHDDAYQIIEQILPYFTPSFTSSAKIMPDLDIKLDTKTTLDGFSMEDMSEGSLDSSNIFIWNLNFTLEGWIFGPVSKSGVIKRVQVDLISVPGSGQMEETPNFKDFGRSSRITTQPGLTADGKPTNRVENSIPYKEIEWDDPYGFIEEVQFFQDGLKYDPKSGKDK